MRLYFFLLFLLFILVFSSPSFGQSSDRPETIVIPVATLGNISESRRQIIQNTLNRELTKYFRLVPQDKFEAAQEKAFDELEFEECTEDQCIILIQEFLQVENVFSLQLHKWDLGFSMGYVGQDLYQKIAIRFQVMKSTEVGLRRCSML